MNNKNSSDIGFSNYKNSTKILDEIMDNKNTSDDEFLNYKNFAKIFDEIEKIIGEIKQKTYIIVKVLNNENNAIVEEISNLDPKLDKKKVLEEAQDFAAHFMDDAETISNELPKFIINKNNKIKLNKECDFLYKVWAGDEYGKSGIEGFKLLLEDLNKQKENIKKKIIVEHVVKVLSAKEEKIAKN